MMFGLLIAKASTAKISVFLGDLINNNIFFPPLSWLASLVSGYNIILVGCMILLRSRLLEFLIEKILRE